jgi:hypothetical protein
VSNDIIDMEPDFYGLVFCRTRVDTSDIAQKLEARGYDAEAIHGDITQAQRERIMQRFRDKRANILVVGPTSSGKTCAAQVCASVVGFPGNPSRGGDARALFQTWNTTPNAVEMLLAPHSGMPVILDEVGANDAGVNLYNAFSGLAKARMTELGGLREQNTWSVLVLSTGEYSVRDHIEQSEVGRVTDGTAVRFQDVPILGVYEAAERLGAPPLPDAQNLAEPIRHLQEQLGQCYGTAMPLLPTQAK